MSNAVELAEVPALFECWLAGRPLADRSRREYARNVRVYCSWLAVTPDRDGWQGDPLSDPLARDHAARDFRRWLQVEPRAAASTVNLALASLDALYRCLGLGRPHVRRDKPAPAAPRALDEAGQRRLLRAAEGAPMRARALVMLMLFTALRISEAVALDVDDVRILTRKGVLVVLGKGEVQREVPLNALVRQVLDEWLGRRKEIAAEGERALFVSRTGGRLSARSADRDVRLVAAGAGLELSAHTLRHTCLTGLVRRGNDLVMVAELAGHQKLETTRRYTLPSAADRQRAVEDLQIDY
ncbi:MAG: tyrosine-type recombinase/integrase [Actinobacteria bacterium]|nr:tyrosine-type recombinase/integrase [Actinomycetota bacterium]MCA1697535.1 tyrosine-type recombinase/integrase [Actinomycetota bacterium]